MRTTASNTMCHLSSLQNDWQIFCRHAIITVLLLWLQFSSTKTSLSLDKGERSKIIDMARVKRLQKSINKLGKKEFKSNQSRQ